MNPKSLKEYCLQGGIIGLLAFVLVTGAQGYWVFGSVYRDACHERDEWKSLALEGARVSVIGRPVLRAQALPADPTPKDVKEVLRAAEEAVSP